ncbi:MAG: hypothetical protein KBT46_08285 [Ruminococcus sp.]|nr:hypothetical protein [Candidatus Copronaster equi]
MNSNIDVSKLINSLDSKKRNELNNILSDKNKLNQVLNSPAAQEIMKKLNGNSNGQHS